MRMLLDVFNSLLKKPKNKQIQYTFILIIILVVLNASIQLILNKWEVDELMLSLLKFDNKYLLYFIEEPLFIIVELILGVISLLILTPLFFKDIKVGFIHCYIRWSVIILGIRILFIPVDILLLIYTNSYDLWLFFKMIELLMLLFISYYIFTILFLNGGLFKILIFSISIFVVDGFLALSFYHLLGYILSQI